MSLPHHTSDGLLKEYNVLSWKIEADLKEFIGKLHREKLFARANAPDLEPQEFNIRIKDGQFVPSIQKDVTLLDINGKLAKDFNRKFLLLFQNVFLPRSESLVDCVSPHHENLLWAGILEAEESPGEEDLDNERLNYSLFCYEHNVASPEGFFGIHRKYADLASELYSLTNYFLDEGKFSAGIGTPDGARAYKPFYISVSTGETQRALSGLDFCQRILHGPLASVCSEFGMSDDDERVRRCIKCGEIERGESDEVSAEDLDSVFSCSYKPYLSSHGAVLRESLAQSIDRALEKSLTDFQTQSPDLLVNRSIILSFINQAFDGVKSDLRISRNEDLVAEGYLSIHSNDDGLRRDLADPEKLKRFINYLIWLRFVGVAGRAKKNWTDYFYFPVPDLSGNYLHTITVASSAAMDPLLFHLIDRNSEKLFQRSMLRLTLKERHLRKDVQSHARRAAVAAVMARNLSHNIGSHVLARLSTPQQLSKHETNAKDAEETLSWVATLNSYLQTRMDFLADLATSTPVVALPKGLYRDVCVYFKPHSLEDGAVDSQRLLADRISGSTFVKRSEIKLTIIVTDNGHAKEIKLTTPLIDPIFAAPNDMLGAHALYVILENIIRNCVKHSEIPSDLEMTVFVDDAGEHWRLRICDNLGECVRSDTLAGELNSKIKESILDADGSLRQGSWGMLEMKIAAAYLRKIPPRDIDDSQTPPLLRAIENCGNLGFELFLRKPKEALIVDFQGALGSMVDDLRPLGVDIVRNYQEAVKRGAEHDFLILAGPDEKQYVGLNTIEEALPGRILVSAKGPRGESRSSPPAPKRIVHLSQEEMEVQLRSGELEAIREYFWTKTVGKNDSASELPTLKDGHCSENGPKKAATDVRVLLPGSTSESECIFFDNHGRCFKHYVEPDRVLYYEPYETKSPTGLILSHLPRSVRRRNTMLHELMYAARLRVAIVDERVQDESQKTCDTYPGIKGRKISDILNWMNILVPAVSAVDLNRQHFDTKESTALKRKLESFAADCDFLLIHLGVIEKLVHSTDEEKIHTWIKAWKNEFPSLVVTSGRGKPSNLPPDTRFLHYSLVNRYIFDERSKYHLSRVLNAARSIPK